MPKGLGEDPLSRARDKEALQSDAHSVQGAPSYNDVFFQRRSSEEEIEAEVPAQGVVRANETPSPKASTQVEPEVAGSQRKSEGGFFKKLFGIFHR